MANESSNSEAMRKLLAGVEAHDRSVESECAVRGDEGGDEEVESE
jgi:hypothetical protein